MSDNKIYIACSVDGNKNFQEITAVMLYSLIKNLDPSRSAYVYILHDPKTVDTLEKYCDNIKNQYPNIEFQFVWVNKSVFEDKQISTYNNLPLWTYYRLLLPDLVDVDKILYLDWDIIVYQDISPLWDIDLGSDLLAGVKTNVLKPWMENIKVDNYINAGMMLIDLRWRKDQDIWSKCIQFCIDHPMWLEGKVKIMWDQCAINKICNGKIKYIEPKYNQTPMCFRWDLDYDVLWYTKDQYNQAIKDPIIIHFAWVDKPWKYNSLHPYNLIRDSYHAWLTWDSNTMRTAIHHITHLYHLNTKIYHLYTDCKNIIKKLIKR